MTGDPDPSIASFYKRCARALAYGWPPSWLDGESNKDLEGMDIINSVWSRKTKTGGQ